MKQPRTKFTFTAAALSALALAVPVAFLATAPAQADPLQNSTGSVDRVDPPRFGPPWEICPPHGDVTMTSGLIFCEIVVPLPPRRPGPDVPPPDPIVGPVVLASADDSLVPPKGPGPYNPIPIWEREFSDKILLTA